MNNQPWPPDYLAELHSRLRKAHTLAFDPKQWALLRAYYAQNPVAWINDWCVTYDPRAKDSKIMPFKLFRRQEEFLQFLQLCLAEKESGLVEKARDIGASWLCCAFSIWLWLFHPGVAIGWGSRKEEYVDKRGDPKAIFPKMRQILENLPRFMLPKGFMFSRDITHMKIYNPENGAVIAGEAGDNMGRGGRTTIYFKDESAHYERPELIEAALGDNTDVQIDISSVNGTANVFYNRRFAGQLWAPNVIMERGKTRVFIFDWRDHPGKTQEWYFFRRKKAEEEGLLHVFLQEVERDYAGALERVVINKEWVDASVDAHIFLGIEISGARCAAQDVADGGRDLNAFVANHGILCNFAHDWPGEAGEAAKIAVPICTELGTEELYYDSIGVGSGFKTQLNTMREWTTWPQRLRVFPWNAGAKPLDPDEPSIPGDGESPLNKNQYANLKAQAWFRTRARFYKTFRAVRYGESFPPDELISISSKIPHATLEKLKRELSQAIKKDNGEGKTVIEKKPQDSKSPNLADAFVACYCPTRELSILDVL